MSNIKLIPMTIWIPDYESQEAIEITLQSEDVKYEVLNDKIIVCQATSELYEFFIGCRNVKPIEIPRIETPIHEQEVNVELPDFDEDEEYPEVIIAETDAAAAAEAAAAAIEEEVKSNAEKPEFAYAEKESLIENIYRVMHNRKYNSIDLKDISVVVPDRYTLSVNRVSLVKGKMNIVSFNITSINGKNVGQTKSTLSGAFVKSKDVTPKLLREILKQINHIK